MNERISQYLFHYVENPDPRYAVMLKGKWGCGKSFFIDKWLDSYKEKYSRGDCSIEPIYVSLYGLKETSQITKSIDQCLHPFLYSKGAEFTKKLFRIAGKIVFKTTFDWNKDGSEEMSFDATLDSLSLLTSKDSEVIGTKLIVFDDLERCLIDMKLLLGYINNFVEHGACHIILIGDETHAGKEATKILIEFKEKTVGREFVIEPDVEAAITYFLTDDIPLSEWLQNQKPLITDVFHATGCDNLRILRQCLYDFNVLYSEVRENLLEKHSYFMQSLLASYIAVYCDFRGECHDLFRQWDWSYSVGVAGDEKTKERISVLQQKYRGVAEKYKLEVLNGNNIKQIIYEIETGCSLKTYVEKTLEQMQRDTTRQDRLVNFMNMSSDVFETECNEMMLDVMNNNIPNMYLFGRSLALLAFFDNEGMFWMTQAAISLAKKYIRNSFLKVSEKEELYKSKAALWQGVGSFGRFNDTIIGSDILEFTNKSFNDCDEKLLNKFEKVLSHITDENVKLLEELSEETTPDRQCTYDMTSVFKNINASDLFNDICMLNNESLTILGQFFYYHYKFYAQLGSGCNRFHDDFIVLSELKSLLESEYSKRRSVDKYVFHVFLKHLDGAIRRANGDNCVIEIK